jgi:hypothetical protein
MASKNCCVTALEPRGAYNGHTCPKAKLMAGSAALMRIMMAELAELTSADSIFAKTWRKHTYIWGNKMSMFGNCFDNQGMGLVLQGNCFFT